MDDYTKASLLAQQAKMLLSQRELVRSGAAVFPVGTRVSFQRQRLETVYRIYGVVEGHDVDTNGLVVHVLSDTGARHRTSLSEIFDLRLEG